MRAADGKDEHVLVIGGVRGLAIALRRGRRRRGRAKAAESEADAEVPVTRTTVIRAGGFAGGDDPERWLGAMRSDFTAADEILGDALSVINRALHAHALATREPHSGGVAGSHALVTRVGYGNGDELADGQWTEALVIPPEPRTRHRAEALRPQERLAAVLGRRDTAAACETLLLRARADLDGDRLREAALQLRVGLEALLAEVSAEVAVPEAGAGAGEQIARREAERQVADLADLEQRRKTTGEAANEALAGELSAERTAEVTETVAICERVLRRRRLLAD